MPWFFGVTLGSMMLGIWTVPRLASVLGKSAVRPAGRLSRRSPRASGSISPDYTATFWIFFWGCLVALGSTPVAVLGWAMIPDTVEYAQWKHGTRADGAIFSTASFFQKLAKTIGGAGVAFVLGLAGYVANQPQEPQASQAILSADPGADRHHGVLIVLTRLYRLDSATHERIVAELAGALAS